MTKPQKISWVEEFDKYFEGSCCNGYGEDTGDTRREIKDFIKALILKEREEWCEELRIERKSVSELKQEISNRIGTEDLALQVCFKEGYNQAVDDLNAKLESIKKESEGE